VKTLNKYVRNCMLLFSVMLMMPSSSSGYAGEFCNDDPSPYCRQQMCTYCRGYEGVDGCRDYIQKYGACVYNGSTDLRPPDDQFQDQSDSLSQPIISDSAFTEIQQELAKAARQEKAEIDKLRNSNKKVPSSLLRDEKQTIKYLKEKIASQKELLASMKANKELYGALGRENAGNILSIYNYELAFHSCIVKKGANSTYAGVIDTCESTFSRYFEATQ
jgi:hypothetical protein